MPVLAGTEARVCFSVEPASPCCTVGPRSNSSCGYAVMLAERWKHTESRLCKKQLS